MILTFTSYTSDGTLTINIDGRRYQYFHISPYQVDKMKYMKKKGGSGRVMQMLKRYSRGDLFDERRGGE